MKKILKTFAKKSMSLFMAVIMLLSCWVFVAPVPEAHAAQETLTYTLEELYNTYLTEDSGATFVKGKFTNDNTVPAQDGLYQNVLYSPAYTNGITSGVASDSEQLGVDGCDSSKYNKIDVYWHHADTVMLYDGVTTPRTGVMVMNIRGNGGNWDGKSVVKGSWLTNSGDDFSFANYWRGACGGNLDFTWAMSNDSDGYTLNYAESLPDSSKQWTKKTSDGGQGHANLIQFTGTMDENRFIVEYKPAFGLYAEDSETGKTLTGTSNTYIRVVNYKTLKEAITDAKNFIKTNIIDDTSYKNKYTEESLNKLAELANALVAAKPDTTYFDGNSKHLYNEYAADAKAAVTAWNTWTGLEKKSYTVTFYDEDETTVLYTLPVVYGNNANVSSLATPTKAPDTYNHYSFAGWSGNYTNVTKDEKVVARYTGTAHTFDGAYKTDADAKTHMRQCTGCTAYGMNGEMNKAVACSGSYSGNDSSHSFTCVCSKSYSHTPTWQNNTATKYRVTGTLTPQEQCVTGIVYKVSCSICGIAHTTNTFTVAAPGHNYQFAKHEPHTCTAPGYDIYRCLKCGTTENREDSVNGQPGTDPAAHSWETQLTDNGNGKHGYKCTKCDAWDQLADHEYELEVITPNTCTDAGWGKYTCKYCPNSYEAEIGLLEHEYDETTLVKIDDSTHGYKCKNCDDYKGVTNHVYSDELTSVKTPATCYADGVGIHTCACGATEERPITTRPAHTWTNNYFIHGDGHAKYCTVCEQAGIETWNTVETHEGHWKLKDVTKEPTCVSVGEGLYVCELCGETKTDVVAIDPNAHDYQNPVSDGNGKHTATCGNNCGTPIEAEECFDKNNDCICDVCDYNIPHKYANFVKAELKVSDADCNSYAVYYKSCSVCGHSEKDINETFEDENGGYGAHDWAEVKEDSFKASDAACETYATYYYKCLECGNSSKDLGGFTWQDKDSDIAHRFDGDIVDNENGTHSYMCSRECGKKGYGSKVNGSTPCNYGAPYYVEGETEFHYEKCLDCGYVKATAHSMSAWAPSADNQGDAKGKHVSSCPDCNYTVTEDCQYGEAVITDATCMHGKIETYTCTLCSHSYSINDGIKDEDNHAYGTWFDEATAIESTCSVAGKDADEKCSGCNEVINVGADRPLNPKNHADYETKIVGKVEATCIIEGHTGTVNCVECNAVLKEDVNLGYNPNNHDPDRIETGLETPPTCEDYGYTDYTKCLDCGKIEGKAKEEPLGHDYTGDVVVLEGDKHAYECKNGCGTHGIGIVKWKTEACSGGTATCETEATCDVCKDKWGKKEMHVFEGDYVKVPGEDAHNQKCKNCDAYGIGTSYETGDSVACSGGKATCTDKPECKYCGEEYGAALGHNFTASKDRIKSYENGEHNYKCLRCDLYGAVVDGAHTVDAVIKCSDNDPITTVATCTEDAYTTYVCDACSYKWVVTEKDSALGHKYEQKLVDGAHLKSEADCVNAATYWYDCVRCDANAKDAADAETNGKYYTYGKANGHKWDAEVKSEDYFCAAATCTTNETYYISCSVCEITSEGTADEATFEVPNTKSGHNWEATETFKKKDASCGVDAEYYYECTNTGCGVSSEKADNGKFWTKEDSALEHTYTEKIEDVAHLKNVANCERGATYYYDCKYCDDNAALLENADEYTFESTVKDSANHTKLETVEYKAPTCTEDGHYAYKKCTGCGYESEITEIPATDHSYTGKIEHIADTDTHKVYCANGCGKFNTVDCDLNKAWTPSAEAGKHEKSCECGNTKTGECTGGTSSCTELKECELCGGKYGETSDHDYTDVEWKKDANADTHSKKCKNCNAKITENCSGGDEATCSAKSVCEVCEEAYGEFAEHTMGETVIITPATCLTNRVEETKCKNYDECGYKVTETIPNSDLGHSMGEFAITKQPTCKDEGIEARRCLRDGCNYTEERTIPADKTKHISDGPFVESDSGDCALGIKYYNKCKVCGEVLKRWSEPGQHDWKAVLVVNPNCITDGFINYECNNCGFTKTEHPEDLKANGEHTWSKQITDAANQYAQWIDADKDGVRDEDEYFTVTATKHPSCQSAGRGYMVCIICKDHSANVAIDKLVHGPEADLADNGVLDNTVIVPYKAPTCERDGHNEYWRCLNCSYSQYNDEEWRKENIIASPGHNDFDGDGKCDDCHGKMFDSDGNNKDDSSCGCMCHNDSWLMQLFYKIARFFWKLFKTNQSCACGFEHY